MFTSRWSSNEEQMFLKDFSKFTGKRLYQSLLFNKVTGLSLQLYQKETPAQMFFCEFSKFIRTPFSQNTSGRLLLCRMVILNLLLSRRFRISCPWQDSFTDYLLKTSSFTGVDDIIEEGLLKNIAGWLNFIWSDYTLFFNKN